MGSCGSKAIETQISQVNIIEYMLETMDSKSSHGTDGMSQCSDSDDNVVENKQFKRGTMIGPEDKHQYFGSGMSQCSDSDGFLI